jgi:hypothetical protein
MCGAHIVRHTTPAAIVMPLTQFLDDPVCPSAPDKLVGTTWLFLKHRWLIELDLYRFTDEPKRFDIHT